jgi:hypothetical protein
MEVGEKFIDLAKVLPAPWMATPSKACYRPGGRSRGLPGRRGPM